MRYQMSQEKISDMKRGFSPLESERRVVCPIQTAQFWMDEGGQRREQLVKLYG